VTRYTTLFCDIGGVLITNPWTLIAKQLSNEYRINRQIVHDRLLVLTDAFDKNQLTLRAFHRHLSNSFAKPIPYRHFEQLVVSSSLRKVPAVWNSVRDLKNSAEISVFAISNISKPVWNSLQRKYGIASLFDNAILSYRVGVTKPDQRIFRFALGETKSRPQECVLLDDSAGNISVAKAMGLKTYRAKNPKETTRFLESLRMPGRHHANANS
jgi:putative hydrolase of the HAD superfamily